MVTTTQWIAIGVGIGAFVVIVVIVVIVAVIVWRKRNQQINELDRPSYGPLKSGAESETDNGFDNDIGDNLPDMMPLISYTHSYSNNYTHVHSQDNHYWLKQEIEDKIGQNMSPDKIVDTVLESNPNCNKDDIWKCIHDVQQQRDNQSIPFGYSCGSIKSQITVNSSNLQVLSYVINTEHVLHINYYFAIMII